MKIVSIFSFINRRLGMIAAILAVVGVVMMVFGSPAASGFVPTDGSELTAISQSQPTIQTKEISQDFTLSGNTTQIITVSPTGIVGVTNVNNKAASTTTTAQTASTPVTTTDPTPAPVTNGTGTATTPPVQTTPIQPVCPVCGGPVNQVDSLKPQHIECPMVCVQ